MKNLCIKIGFWIAILFISNQIVFAQTPPQYPDIKMEHRLHNLRYDSNVQPNGALIFNIQIRAGSGYETAGLPMIATNIQFDFILEPDVTLNLAATTKTIPANPVYITNIAIATQTYPTDSIALNTLISRESYGTPHDFTEIWVNVATITVPLASGSARPTSASYSKIRPFDGYAFWATGWGSGLKPGIAFAYELSCPEEFRIGIDPNAIINLDDIQKTYCLGISTAQNPLPTEFSNINPDALHPTPISGKWEVNGVQVDTVSTSVAGTTIYTFVPNHPASYCNFEGSIEITVNQNVAPIFTFATEYCRGTVPAALPLISNNGIPGTWFPQTISTEEAGVTVYTFTPNEGGCLAGTIEVEVTVNDNPMPVFTFATEYCMGTVPDELPLICNKGTSGTWLPQAISTEEVGVTVYTFTPNGGECFSGTVEVEVTVKDCSEIPFVFAQNFIYCDGEEATEYIFTGSEHTAFNWHRVAGHDLGLDATSGINKLPAFMAANYGFEAISAVYQVTPVNEYGVAGQSQNFIITVNPRPVISKIQDMEYCSGSIVPGYYFSSNMPNVFFEWEFVEESGSTMIEGIPASGENFIPTFVAQNFGNESVTGKYRVRVSYVHANLPCYDQEWQEFSITVSPQLVIMNMSDAELFLCPDEDLYLFVEANGSAQYQWYYERKMIQGATQAYYETAFDASKAGVYSLAISDACGNTTYYFFNVQLNSIIIEVKFDDALYVNNTGDKYVAYQWYKNGQPISQNGTSQYYTEPGGFTPHAEYNLKAYKADGSYDEACPIIPNNGSNPNTSFKVYPNPTTSGSTITILLKPGNDEQPNAVAYIYDITGKIVKSLKITNYTTEVVVDFAVSTYMVKVVMKSGKEFVEKIIIQ